MTAGRMLAPAEPLLGVRGGEVVEFGGAAMAPSVVAQVLLRKDAADPVPSWVWWLLSDCLRSAVVALVPQATSEDRRRAALTATATQAALLDHLEERGLASEPTGRVPNARSATGSQARTWQAVGRLTALFLETRPADLVDLTARVADLREALLAEVLVADVLGPQLPGTRAAATAEAGHLG